MGATSQHQVQGLIIIDLAKPQWSGDRNHIQRHLHEKTNISTGLAAVLYSAAQRVSSQKAALGGTRHFQRLARQAGYQVNGLIINGASASFFCPEMLRPKRAAFLE